MQPRTRKMKAKGRKKQNTSQGIGQFNTDGPGKYKSLNLVFPPRMCMKMKFWGEQAFSLAATTGTNYRYRPSAAFDIDPALGGTSMAGFAEMAAQYATYRVIASRIKVTFSNPSATVPIVMTVTPLNADPTNAMTVSNIVASVGQPYAKTKQVGLLGCPPITITNSMQTKVIWGDPAIFYDHNFSSLVTTVPANNWFWNVTLYAPVFIATPLYATVEITVDCEFFDRYFLPA